MLDSEKEMNIDPMMVFLFILWIICCFGVGKLSTESAAQGPIVLLSVGLSVGLLFAVGLFLSELNYPTDQTYLGCILRALVIFAATTAIPISAYFYLPAEAKESRFWAPRVQAYVIDNFAALDADGDGTITEPELWAFKKGTRSAEEETIVRQLDLHWCMDGHVTVRHDKSDECGISRGDMQSYTARVIEMYKNWPDA